MKKAKNPHRSSHKHIVPGPLPKKKRWRFSLRFWRQVRYFGLDKSTPSWFVSTLEKLAEYSAEEVDTFFTDLRKAEQLRFHKINWNHPNIPIKRSDLSWIDNNYKDNEQEFPFYQIQISTGLGRIIGFFDEEYVFNIVLLDPMHNCQPTHFNHYKLRECSPLANDFAILLSTVQKVVQVKWCNQPGCGVKKAIEEISAEKVKPGIIILNLSEHLYRKVLDFTDGHKPCCIEDVLSYGMVYLDNREEEMRGGEGRS